MALPDLEDHLAENGVDPALSSHLISGGWNSQNFAAVVDSKAGFTDDIWAELSDQPIPLVQRANLKVAWQRLQPETVSTSGSTISECLARGFLGGVVCSQDSVLNSFKTQEAIFGRLP